MKTVLIGIYYLLNLYYYFMIIVIIISWIPDISQRKWYIAMRKVSDIYLSKFRGWFSFNMIDFTPAIGLIIYDIALFFIRYIITII